MKRNQIKTDASPNFIGNWNIENNDLCSRIIEFFEQNSNLHFRGKVSGGINEKVKKTTDLTIMPKDLKNENYDLFNEYFKHLYECYTDYREQFPFLKTFLKKIDIGPFNIQKYLAGDHFSEFHSERTEIATVHRIFAWMTYLNDVEDGGTTDFDYYKVKVKPECGKTLIWPAEWTHMHRGAVLKSGKKYIITGWLHFKS